MKKVGEVITIVLGGLLIFFFITQLPQFFEYHHEYKFDDTALRKKALDININPIPTNFSEASKLLTFKNGEISYSEISLGKNSLTIPYFQKIMILVVQVVINLKRAAMIIYPQPSDITIKKIPII